MSKRLRFYICIVMLLLLYGCGMDNNQRGEVETVSIKMTEEEIALMTDVYGEEDRMRSGDLFDFHVEALQQLRAGMEYLEKKYPECGVKIINFSPATKISTQAQFLLKGEGEESYTMALQIVGDEYVCTDDYYSVFVRDEYDRQVSTILESGGVAATVYTTFASLLGEAIGKDVELSEFLTVASEATRKTDIFILDTENKEHLKEEIQDLIENAGLYGSYVIFFVDEEGYSDREEMEKNRLNWDYLTFNYHHDK